MYNLEKKISYSILKTRLLAQKYKLNLLQMQNQINKILEHSTKIKYKFLNMFGGRNKNNIPK